VPESTVIFRFEGEVTAHGCAFCGNRILFDEPDQLPLIIPNGGGEHRFWAHRACFRERVQPQMQAAVDRIPPARREDVFPKRPA
jgi:hypothetical protein